MSFLLNSINNINETFKKAASFDSDLGMMSGFTPIDILSTNIEHFTDNHQIEILNGGLFCYPYNEIGLSAVGKTSFWIQTISGCIDNWYRKYGPVSECVFYNVEGHTSPKRWQDLTGWDNQQMQERVRFISKPWSIIEIYNDIALMAKRKKACRNELEITTDIVSITGEPVKILPTTYVLIDSLAAVRTKTELEFDKEGNVKNGDTIAGSSNMDAMQIAKDNTIFINEVKKLCDEVNICLIIINHCVEVPVLDRYNPPKPQLPGMKFNQRVKGGTELLYQSFGVGMLSIRERLFNDKSKIYGDAVHGLIAFMDWLKNKNGPEGVRLSFVFDSATGYKPELTDFENLYTEGCYGILGSPMAYKLAVLPEVSFTRKNLLEKCHQIPLLARALSFTARLYLISKYVLRQTPPDLTGVDDMPFEDRLDLIMRYSMDYPGYINHGWVVDDSIIEYVMYLNSIMNRDYVENMNLQWAEAELLKEGLCLIYDTFTPFGNETTIGETEYIVSDQDDSKWS